MADAVNVIRANEKLKVLTPQEQIIYDVAPLSPDGVPAGNGVVDMADVILILRRSLGLVNW